jgi:hypothetical protein
MPPLLLISLQLPKHHAVWLEKLLECSNNPDARIHDVFLPLGLSSEFAEPRKPRNECIATEGNVILFHKYRL